MKIQDNHRKRFVCFFHPSRLTWKHRLPMTDTPSEACEEDICDRDGEANSEEGREENRDPCVCEPRWIKLIV